jgi:hypothetical protein
MKAVKRSKFAKIINRQLKIVGSLILLAILFLQGGGMLLIYKIQQYYVHDNMIQNINSSKTQFQEIVLTLSDYQKCRINASEITINNKLYDVKSANIYGDRVKLLVLNDSMEENILVKIAEFTNNTRHPNSVLCNNLKHLLTLSYLPQPGYSSFFIYPSSVDKFIQFNLNYISRFPEILTPPPRLD